MKNLFKIRLGRERWHRAIILFISIFVFALIIQFAFRWYERGTEARNRLRESAEDISKYIDYSDRWALARLWRADFIANNYCVLDKDGLIINIQGFLPAMTFHVSLNQLTNGLQTIALPETGETWRILVKPLVEGTLILGISPPQDVTKVDKRLLTSAELFGSSLEKASSVKMDQVDMYLEYAIIDNNQKLRFSNGAIPLRVIQMPIYPVNAEEVIAEDGLAYGVFSKAVQDKKGRPVGMIYTLEKLDPQPWLIMRTWIFNCLSSALMAFFGTLIGIPYIGDKFDPRRLLNNVLQKGESQTVEFKESVHWHQLAGQPQPAGDARKNLSGEEIVIRTTAALLNNQDGGSLLIGIRDDMSIAGLNQDYEYLVKKGEQRGDRNKDRDLFQRHLRDVLATKIRRDVINLCIETAIVERAGNDVCIINARPSAVPIYIPVSLADSKTKAFFVREGASTKPLDVEQTMDYMEQRWPRTIWGRIRNYLRS